MGDETAGMNRIPPLPQTPSRNSPSRTHIVPCWVFLGSCLDTVGQKAEDGTNPQEDGKPSKELAAELHPLRSGGWGGECIGAITSQDFLGFAVGQTLMERQNNQVHQCPQVEATKLALVLQVPLPASSFFAQSSPPAFLPPACLCLPFSNQPSHNNVVLGMLTQKDCQLSSARFAPYDVHLRLQPTKCI